MGTLTETRCPRCGTVATMVPIVFGYPSPDMAQAADRGDVFLGGCIVSGEDATHVCAACSQEVIVDDPETCARAGARRGVSPAGLNGASSLHVPSRNRTNARVGVHIQFDSESRVTQACGRCSGRAKTCASCGLKLDGDPEDDPTDASGPICGECNRARNFDLDEELAWANED